MHHYFEAITNKSGDSLPGYFARVVDPATQNTVVLAADNNGTPIVTTSGIENAAKTDENGNVSFYVPPGTYHLDIYAQNATSFIMRVPNVAMNSGVGPEGPQGEPGPQGEGLAEVMAPTGSTLVGFTHSATYPQGNIGNHLKRFVMATDAPFNAKADGVTDDADAIQAALNYVGNNGGGTVWIPAINAGRYRITKTLEIPAHTTLKGSTFTRYPYNAGNTNSSSILADFSDYRNWIVQAKTRKMGGGLIAYDEIVRGQLDDYIPAINARLEDVTVTSQGIMPYGGVRMHGAPGSRISGVGVNNAGIGLLVNYSFGGNYSLFALTPYYGVIAWNDVNACIFDGYAGHAGATGTIPANYRFAPIASQNGGWVRGGSTVGAETHSSRSFGFVMGAGTTDGPSSCVNSAVNMVSENYSGAFYLANAYAIDFGVSYCEGAIDYGLVSFNSRFTMSAFHAFGVSSTKVFDFGDGTQAVIFPAGIVLGDYGYGPPLNTTTRVVFEGVKPEGGWLVPTPQYNVLYRDSDYLWQQPALTTGWTNFGDVFAPYGARRRGASPWVDLRGGLIKGASAGDTAFTLPIGLRPSFRQQFMVVGGTVVVDPSGEVKCYPSGANIFIDGIGFSVL